MSQDIKQIIREEYLKCASNPAHFMRKYCYIQHPQRGRVLFNLYPFQDKVLNLWKDNPYDIILKSRQLGISTLVAGYSLWLMLFHKDKNILCIATKQETASDRPASPAADTALTWEPLLNRNVNLLFSSAVIFNQEGKFSNMNLTFVTMFLAVSCLVAIHKMFLSL